MHGLYDVNVIGADPIDLGELHLEVLVAWELHRILVQYKLHVTKRF